MSSHPGTTALRRRAASATAAVSPRPARRARAAMRPEISVIIPTRDRLEILRRVIDGLARQDLDFARFEVIVVDDGSSDGSCDWLRRYSQAAPFYLIVLNSGGEGAAAARNRGIEASSGELLLFLDADTIPAANLLRYHLALHGQERRAECHMGRIEMSRDLMQPGQARWNELRLTADDPASGEITFRRYRTANTSLPRHLVRAAGGFSEKLRAAEDLELAYRLARNGVRFYYHQDLLAVHHHPLPFRAYWDKAAVYGAAVAAWLQQQPELGLELARRFGFDHAGLTWRERLRYLVKRILVNRITVRLLAAVARSSRNWWFAASERLFKAIYGYYLRRSFQAARRASGVDRRPTGWRLSA